MKTYTFERCDYYIVEVEAKSKAQALKLVESEDEYLNGGTFSESVFTLEDEDE